MYVVGRSAGPSTASEVTVEPSCTRLAKEESGPRRRSTGERKKTSVLTGTGPGVAGPVAPVGLTSNVVLTKEDSISNARADGGKLNALNESKDIWWASIMT